MKFASITFLALLSLLSWSCCDNSQDMVQYPVDTLEVSIEQLLVSPEAYVNRLVRVSANCTHVCQGAGRKAFLTPSQGDGILKCVALAQMNGQFEDKCQGRPITVVGIFREERIDENAIEKLIEDRNTQKELLRREGIISDTAKCQLGTAHDCDTEKHSQGQDTITSFNSQIQDYRNRILERKQTAGLPYISFYHLDASGYSVH